MQRWTVSYGAGTVQWPLNPREGALPSFERNYTVQPSSLGAPVIFESPNETQTMQFSGDLVSRDHHLFFRGWFRENAVCTIVDDLDNTYTGVLKKYSPKRQHRSNNDWAGTYDVEVLLWAGTDF